MNRLPSCKELILVVVFALSSPAIPAVHGADAGLTFEPAGLKAEESWL